MVVHVSIGIFLRKINREGFELWMQQRHDPGSDLDRKWEFPGGKIELSESAEDALIREIKEEVDFDLRPLKFRRFKIHPYQYGEKKIVLQVFIIQAVNAMAEKITQRGQWWQVSFAEASKPFQSLIPKANIPILNELSEYLRIQCHSNALDYLWM
jgi:8-oxo-dGTP diphosphatase